MPQNRPITNMETVVKSVLETTFRIEQLFNLYKETLALQKEQNKILYNSYDFYTSDMIYHTLPSVESVIILPFKNSCVVDYWKHYRHQSIAELYSCDLETLQKDTDHCNKFIDTNLYQLENLKQKLLESIKTYKERAYPYMRALMHDLNEIHRATRVPINSIEGLTEDKENKKDNQEQLKRPTLKEQKKPVAPKKSSLYSIMLNKKMDSRLNKFCLSEDDYSSNLRKVKAYEENLKNYFEGDYHIYKGPN